MEPKLKELLIKKIKLAQKDLADDPRLKVKLEGKGRLVSLGGDVQRPKNALLILVRKKLLKARRWESAEAALAQIALLDFIREFERKEALAISKVELSAARERQLALFPGFEKLPTRIRSGNRYLKFPDAPVSEFLSYAESYSRRAQRNQATAVELMSLALKVRPFADGDPTVADAFKRANSQPSTLVVVPRLGANG